MIDEIIEQLLKRMRPVVQGRDRGVMHRHFSTSDVLQEAAIQLLYEFDGKNDPEAVSQAWLNCVGRGHSAKLRKRHSAQKRSAYATVSTDQEYVSNDPSPDVIVEHRELWAKTVTCLAKLRQDQRTIIHEHDVNGVSFRAIAEDLNRPEQWVRRRYHAAMKELKNMLTEMGSDEKSQQDAGQTG